MYHRFAVGESVVTARPIVIPACSTTIDSGEPGKIVDVSPDDGSILVQLDRYYEKLAERRNLVVIDTPENTIRKPPWRRPRGRLYASIAACMVTLMIGYMIEPPWLNASQIPQFAAPAKVQVITPIIHRGEPLILSVIGARDEECSLTVDRYFWSGTKKVGHDNLKIESYPRDAVTPSVTKVMPPQDLIPGRYQYSTEALAVCETHNELRTSPMLSFEIADRAVTSRD